MPLLHPHLKHRKQKIMIRGHVKGSGIIDTATMALIQSGLPWDKIFGSIGAATYGALGTAAATYGIKKLTEHINAKSEHPVMVNPPLTVSPAPQNTIKGDILPVRNNTTTIVDESNHYIDLPDGMKKMNVGTVRQGYGIKKKGKGMSKNYPAVPPRYPPRELNNILSDKSKQILTSMKNGNGIMKF